MDPLTLPLTTLQELISRLTPRQMEIVTLLAQGKTNREISTLLSISVETVKTHIQKACAKVGADNRTQLIVAYAATKAISHL